MPGAPLDPDHVIGRADDAALAWTKLEHGSLRLNEPRRIGKTSFLRLLAHDPAPGWVVVNQTFQGIGSTEALVARALDGIARHRSVRKRVADAARALLGSSKVGVTTADGVTVELAPAPRADPLGAFERALADVARALHPDEHLLLAWDEVPDMITAIADREGDAAAIEALGLMRRFRESTGGTARIRWILTGSVGFHHLLRRLGRDDLLNELDAFELGPLTSRWSDHLGTRLLLGAGVEDPQPEVVRELTAVTGGLPVLLHLVARDVRDGGRRSLAVEEVRPTFERAVADLDRSHQLTSFLTRLGPYYGDREEAARWILDRVAEQPCTAEALRSSAPKKHKLSRTAAVGALLDSLVLDHYLVKQVPLEAGAKATYAWRYPPLQRIWELRRP